jgi:phage gp29-like protein
LSKESISRVRQAELEAARIRDEAQTKARKTVEESQRICAEEAAAHTEATARELNARLEDVRKKTEALVERSRSEAGEDGAALEAEANEKMQEAVRTIVGEMFSACQ